MAPSDAAVALRSLPRRFRAVLVRGDDEDTDRPDHVVRRPADDGLSGLDHAGAAVRAVAERAPQVGPGVAATGTAGDVLAALEVATSAYADEIERVTPGDWTSEALDQVAAIVTAAVDHLRAAERAVDAARRAR